ncbi:MAG: hypothetical protein RI894_390 [Bacteroidota bacterium]|jgi:hypothetical protein
MRYITIIVFIVVLGANCGCDSNIESHAHKPSDKLLKNRNTETAYRDSVLNDSISFEKSTICQYEIKYNNMESEYRYTIKNEIVTNSYNLIGFEHIGHSHLKKISNNDFKIDSYHPSGRAETHSYFRINYKTQEIYFIKCISQSHNTQNQQFKCIFLINKPIDEVKKNYDYYLTKYEQKCQK